MSDADNRPRKRRTTLLSVLSFALLVIAAAAAVTYIATRPVTLRLAVAVSDGDDAKAMHAIAAWLAGGRSSIRLSVVETRSDAESLALLTTSQADIGMARCDIDLPSDAQSLAVLRHDVVVFWAPKALGRGRSARPKIEAFADLAGRRIGLISRRDGDMKLLKLVLNDSGIAPDGVTISLVRPDQIAQAAHDPAYDAFMFLGPLESKLLSDAIRLSSADRGEPVFLPIDAADAIVRKHPAIKAATIPGQTFAGRPARPSSEIATLAVDHLFLARRALPDRAAAAFTRQLLSARQSLVQSVPEAARIEKPDTDKDATPPAHPGAAAFVDGTERTWLETYSDQFWVAVLLLSVVGSAGAWLGHYLKRDERDLNTVHRDRLLSVITKVRQASTEVELATLQTDIDVVLRETLDCYDDGAIDEGGLLALGLVLDRLHVAIIERRAELAFEGPAAARLVMARPTSRLP